MTCEEIIKITILIKFLLFLKIYFVCENLRFQEYLQII